MLGRIRSATGGARLLMRQKLSQFAGLVDMAENKTGPTKTTAQDLQVSSFILNFSLNSNSGTVRCVCIICRGSGTWFSAK